MIGATVISVFTTIASGWPFAALMFVAFAVNVVFRFRVRRAIFAGALSAVVILAVTSFVDALFYQTDNYQGRGQVDHLTSISQALDFASSSPPPVVNAAVYNAPGFLKRWLYKAGISIFSSSQSESQTTPHLLMEGSELYGVAPFSYYPKNLALNFNTLALFAILAIPFVWVRGRWFRLWYFTAGTPRDEVDEDAVLFITDSDVFRQMTAPFFTWLAVLATLPHKEERFLFPMYPLLCLYGVVI